MLTFLSTFLGLVAPWAFKAGDKFIDLKLQTARHKQEMEMSRLTAEIDLKRSEVDASSRQEVARARVDREKVKMGNQVTQFAFVEILRGTLRPFITYMFVLGSLTITYLLIREGLDNGATFAELMESKGLQFLFGTCSTVIAFWFSDRAVNGKRK